MRTARTVLLDLVIDQFYNLASVRPEEVLPLAKSFELKNYPNPFNPFTKIHYQLKHPATVRLTIYNIQGQQVSGLVTSVQLAGKYLLV